MQAVERGASGRLARHSLPGIGGVRGWGRRDELRGWPCCCARASSPRGKHQPGCTELLSVAIEQAVRSWPDILEQLVQRHMAGDPATVRQVGACREAIDHLDH